VFSGIVETLGTVRAHTRGRIEIVPRTPFAHLELGESIAVNGACLTVATVDGEAFAADVMPETLQRTTLGELTEGATVNLERALQFGDRVGGHMVSGHVDATGIVTALREDANARWVTIATPDDIIDLVAEKGSIAVDGISLTVVDVFEAAFTVSLIPVTLAQTVAGAWRVATRVNLEVDLIARYVARTLSARDRRATFATAAAHEG
jgi:riboflavin synthase